MSEHTSSPASLRPFSCSYSREVPDILQALDCSLVLTTYQAGKLLFISPDGENLVQLPRNFRRPMGMAVDGRRLAVAAQYEVVFLEDAPSLVSTYPRKPDHYDALYVPRASFYTGTVDLHDMAFASDTLWAVNTLFSCLCTIDTRYSFTPRWKPSYISKLAPEDRCHLNGLAMKGGKPLYVTTLSATDTPGGWRENRLAGGTIQHVPDGEIVLNGLPMPHSPRWYDGKLFFVLAATGEVCCADLEAGKYDIVNRVPGFARGVARHGDYLFVGHSKLRKKHEFGDLPLVGQPHYAGVVIIHLPSGNIAGGIRYHTSCEEIYDVHVLAGVRRPGVLGVEDDQFRMGIHIPGGGFWAKQDNTETKDVLS